MHHICYGMPFTFPAREPCCVPLPTHIAHCHLPCRLAPGQTWEAGLKLRFHNRYWDRPVWDRAEAQPMPPLYDTELMTGGGGGVDAYAGIGAEEEGDDE